MITSLLLFTFIIILLLILIAIIVPNRCGKYKKTYLKLGNIEELYELHNHSEVYIGQIVEVVGEKKYILTSIDFKTFDPWEIWKPFEELEKDLAINKKWCCGYELNQFKDHNSKPLPDYIKIFCISGSNFEHRGFKDKSAIGLNIARIPRLGDIVADRKLVLWEVISIKDNGVYMTLELSRPDGRHRYACLEDVYGVATHSWDVKFDIY